MLSPRGIDLAPPVCDAGEQVQEHHPKYIVDVDERLGDDADIAVRSLASMGQVRAHLVPVAPRVGAVALQAHLVAGVTAIYDTALSCWHFSGVEPCWPRLKETELPEPFHRGYGGAESECCEALDDRPRQEVGSLQMEQLVQRSLGWQPRSGKAGCGFTDRVPEERVPALCAWADGQDDLHEAYNAVIREHSPVLGSGGGALVVREVCDGERPRAWDAAVADASLHCDVLEQAKYHSQQALDLCRQHEAQLASD